MTGLHNDVSAMNTGSDEAGMGQGSPALEGLEQGEAKGGFSFGGFGLMILVVALAGGVLAGMRQLGLGPHAATAGAMKIETQDPAKLAAAHKQVMADLSTARVEMQVPFDRVRTNPFRTAGIVNLPAVPSATSEEPTDLNAMVERARQEQQKRLEAERQKQVLSLLQSLELNSVLGGPSPVARINNKIYRIGDRVEGLFLFKSAEGRAVVLEAEGQEHRIEMAIGGHTGRGGSGPR